jgi:4-alpha-glucanotransferase
MGTWVLQSSLWPRAAQPLRRVPRHVVAGLNTHDMFPFAGFLRGDDINARSETGQVDPKGASRELAARHRLVARLEAFLQPASAARPAPHVADGEDGAREAKLLRGALAYLSSSQAAVVVVNLEDLLHETRPQNLPGTGAERANWRRKIAGTEEDVHQAIAEAAAEMGTD